ncbi:hypothetical protein B0O99DRAFT_512373 [Bisporella sp. PMI_857]|nr:hypothetical protein B0O99DRAFT_512373 [Bisporella sp. PMI_857]
MSSRSAVPRRPHLTSLMYSLPIRRLKEILNRVLPTLTLGPVEEVPSTQLARLYSLGMSDGRKLLLSFAPSLAVRLLRHETTMLSSEASLIYFLTGTDSSRDSENSISPLSERPPEIDELIGLVPKLLKHSANNREMAYPYSIFEAVDGVPLSTVSIYLTISERRIVDKQLGSMVRVLASMTSPSRTFGTVNLVLPEQLTPGVATFPPSKGALTWSEGFNLLLEGILRDGEDIAVLLPYETIRNHYRRLSWRLDAVQNPRLLILDAGSDTNVMIERAPEDTCEEASSKDPSKVTKLTGLRSWSQGVFGDPLLSNCFEDPSDAFLEGWREGGDDVIEDQENAEVRMLIYRSFRAVVSIVTEFYRPQGDSSRKELEARRRLTSALAELEKVDSLKRARSSSTEAGVVSKRIKIERVVEEKAA